MSKIKQQHTDSSTILEEVHQLSTMQPQILGFQINNMQVLLAMIIFVLIM